MDHTLWLGHDSLVCVGFRHSLKVRHPNESVSENVLCCRSQFPLTIKVW